MKTTKNFAVCVYDNTCNLTGHGEGLYGAGDYRWINEPLNGGEGEYSIETLEEAESVMTDFQKVAEENNLEWASFGICVLEIHVAESLQDIADYYNENDMLNTEELEALIKGIGAVSDCSSEWGVCHNDSHKVVVNDIGEAVVCQI